MKLEVFWFDDCPNHQAATALLNETLDELGVSAEIEMVKVPDLETGVKTKFAGSPSIRVNGKDIDPGYEDTGDYTPRCRVYFTSEGFKGLPEKAWITDAVREAIAN